MFQLMSMLRNLSVDEDFGANRKLLRVYYIYYIVFICILIMPWFILFLIANSNHILIPTIVVAVVIAIIAYLIYSYYRSIHYHLGNQEMEWRRGIFFKRMGIVPYSKITNIDIVQGPLFGLMGIATLKIQTAGYSGMQNSPEVKIEGVERYQEIRDLLLSRMHGIPQKKEHVKDDELLLKLVDEVTEIKQILEKNCGQNVIKKQ